MITSFTVIFGLWLADQRLRDETTTHGLRAASGFRTVRRPPRYNAALRKLTRIRCTALSAKQRSPRPTSIERAPRGNEPTRTRDGD